MDTRWSCRGCWMRKPSYQPSTQCDESTMAFRRRPETSQSRDSGQISVYITHSFAFSNRSFCIAPIRSAADAYREKGTHGAKTAIEKWIRKDPKHTKYVLKLDVRKCYPTMNHEELRKKLQRRIKDKFLRLADRIIASFQQPMATHEKTAAGDRCGRHPGRALYLAMVLQLFLSGHRPQGRRENRNRAT